LYFPATNGEMTVLPAAVAPTETITHKVKKGETLYGISHQYGITVDQLIDLNPSARDGVKAGEELIVARPEAPKATPAVATDGGSRHVIAQGETLYRIAADRGLTVEQVLAANPGLDPFNYSVGTEIILPGVAEASGSQPIAGVKPQTPQRQTPAGGKQTPPSAGKLPAVTAPTIDDNDADDAPKAEIPEKNMPHQPVIISFEDPMPEGRESFDVAVVLPFMLKEANPSRQAKMYTDFYRGMLMAAERNNSDGKEIRLHVYDSAGSNDTVKALMSRPEMRQMALIVAPDTDEQLMTIVNSVDEDSTFVFNPFVVRNTAYLDHANVIQANIPQELMLSKAVEAFIANLDGYTPVFISRIKGQAEKDQFVKLFKEQLADRAIKFEEITFSDVLEATDLQKLDPVTAYAFVPISGQRGEFLKYVEALKAYAVSNPQGVKLLGYPDFVTFRGQQLDDLSELNTLIYTRFYFDPTYYPSRRFAQDFEASFGSAMIEAAPIMAVSGYDAGNYIFKALRNNGGDFHLKSTTYNGLQTNYIITDDQTDGLVNTSL
ncbi:MAG: LysM peptidoglycan-binding domain-containing protein, partial [Muribaculaceae bacterium]|nr:LysM peptidoglycan-binding domain-containing protein [Muribaculaceae bacterium]